MSPRSRRALLRAFGVGAAGLVAGCPDGGADSTDEHAGTPTGDPSSPSMTVDQPVETPTVSLGETTGTQGDEETSTETETATETETETVAETETSKPPTGEALDPGLGPRPDQTWPLPDRSVTNDAYAPESVAFERSPAVEWTIEATDPTETSHYDPRFTTPLVADGQVYVVNELLYGPNVERPDQQYLRAYDQADGTEDWTYEFSDEGSGEAPTPTLPAVRDRVVYVGTHQTLHAVDRAEGSVLWARSFDDRLLTLHPTTEYTYVVAYDRLVALDDSGATVWERDLFDVALAAPALGLRSLYVGTSGRHIHAFDPATGEERWDRRVQDPTEGDQGGWAVRNVVATAGGVLANRAGGFVYAFDERGELVWTADGTDGALTTDGSRVFSGAAEGRIQALDVPGGDGRWNRAYDGTGKFEDMVLADGVLYAASPYGSTSSVVAIDPEGGAERWRYEGDVDNLALDDETVYAVEDDTLLRALR